MGSLEWAGRGGHRGFRVRVRRREQQFQALREEQDSSFGRLVFNNILKKGVISNLKKWLIVLSHDHTRRVGHVIYSKMFLISVPFCNPSHPRDLQCWSKKRFYFLIWMKFYWSKNNVWNLKLSILFDWKQKIRWEVREDKEEHVETKWISLDPRWTLCVRAPDF